jgi:hypothetical protein
MRILPAFLRQGVGQGIGAGFDDNGDCAAFPRRITHSRDFALSKSDTAISRPKSLQSIADRLRIVISHLVNSSSDRHIPPYDDLSRGCRDFPAARR